MTKQPRNATSMEDFYETLEPLPDAPRDLLAEVLGEIITQCFMSKEGNARSCDKAFLPKRMTSAFRKFVALVWVVRPQAIPGDCRAWEVAESVGITKQALSLLTVQWSDKLNGLRGPGMKSQEARQKYSNAQIKSVHAGRGKGKNHRRPDRIGERTDQTEAARTERLIAEAVAAFQCGDTWTIHQKHALASAGFIDDADQLTASGLQMMQAATTHPPIRKLSCVPTQLGCFSSRSKPTGK